MYIDILPLHIGMPERMRGGPCERGAMRRDCVAAAHLMAGAPTSLQLTGAPH